MRPGQGGVSLSMLRRVPNILTSLRIAAIPVLVWLAAVRMSAAFTALMIAFAFGVLLTLLIALLRSLRLRGELRRPDPLLWAMLLAVARNVPQAHAALVQGRWERSKWEGVELFDKVLGVAGLGRIGKLVAQRAAAFGMRVIGVSRTPRTIEGFDEIVHRGGW